MITGNEWFQSRRAAVDRLLREKYEIAGTCRLLPGEYDLNVRVDAVAGSWLLKIMRPGCDPAFVDMQCRALERLAERAPELPLQRVVPARDGALTTVLADADGERLVWLLTFLPGRAMASVRPHPPALLEGIGEALGRLDAALAGFEHPALDRELKWNLCQAAWILPHLKLIHDPRQRDWLARIMDRFTDRVAPRLGCLRRGAIYGDANDYNLLVDYDEQGRQRLSGIVDFGDMCRSVIAGEAAVASAYAMMGQDRPLEAAAGLIAAYHRVLPLTDEELALLFPLVLTRLAVSVVNAAVVARERPGDAYVTVSEAPAWRLLERLHDYDPRRAEARWRAACGLAAHPGAARVCAWLRERSGTFAEVLGPDRPAAAGQVLDLSFASTVGGSALDGFDPADCAGRVDALLSAGGKQVGIGRWGEPRPIYTAPAFGDDDPLAPRRTRHLGVDLFAPAGTPVRAPLAGEVAGTGWSSQRFDYGGWVLLRHRTDDGDPFATFYGHLARSAFTDLEFGRRVDAGEAFTALGDRPENGDWPPHLHLQLLAAADEMWGDTPDGVADPDDFDACTALYPNPAPLLNLPDAVTQWADTSLEALRSRRAARFAPNLRLSYAEPFRPVRGWRHFLYDADGRAYLDAYNNVPHVGHCHPKVVAAAVRQLRLLNTNTRYLYDGLAELAERLTAKLPEPLSVCFFVNSGSEANELALRLARAHTGARDMLVMDHAYHGHTTGAMAISPYKFNRPGGGGAEEWVHVTPVPDTYRGPHRAGDPETGARYAADVRTVLAAVQGKGRRVAGYIAECLPSVGGQIVPPPGFVAEVYRDVRAAGGVCIADDVQTALGRLGATFWGFEYLGVVPDILVLGKPMGNGYPLAAVVTTPAVAQSFASGPEFFSTFGGSTVSCAVGIAVQQVLDEEGLQAHAARVGAELLSGLAALAGEFPLIGDVRGTGLFIGVDLVIDRDTRAPATAQAAYVKDRLRERRVLLGTEGPHDNVLKIRPPMTFDSAAAARLLETLADILAEDPAQPGWPPRRPGTRATSPGGA